MRSMQLKRDRFHAMPAPLGARVWFNAWLARQAGLSIDNLLSAEVVTADGQVRRASAEENPDLFWAIRGGGGNFGVVTEFEFRLHEVGPIINFGMLFWTADQGRQVFELVRDLSRRCRLTSTSWSVA